MMKPLKHVILASSLILPPLVQADITMRPVGIQIVWDSLKDEFGGFKTFNSDAGVSINFGVFTTEKGFIEFDKNKSKIALSAGGNDLVAKFGTWNRISEDTKTLSVVVVSEEIPDLGSGVFKLKGELVAAMASQTDTKATDARAFKKGDQVELFDGFQFEIDKMGKPEWGDDPLSLSLKWKRAIPELAAVRFFDAEGNEIESSSAGSTSWSAFGKVNSVTKSYNLKKKVKEFKIEMDIWNDLEEKILPVDLEVTSGGSQ